MKKVMISLLMLLAVGQWSTVKAENTDVSTLDNVIYIEPFNVETAGSQVTLSFKMKNSVGIRAFQFDLYLPEGVTVAKTGKGRIQGELTASRLPEEDEHTLTFSEQPDGAIRFLCGSQYDETFTGNDGEICTLSVNVAAGMTDGDYAIQLKNMKLTETDISKFYEHELVETTMTIGETTGIGELNAHNSEFKINNSDAVYNLKGQQIAAPQKGVYVVGGKKIVRK